MACYGELWPKADQALVHAQTQKYWRHTSNGRSTPAICNYANFIFRSAQIAGPGWRSWFALKKKAKLFGHPLRRREQPERQ
jgi:hypothetical protein